MNILLINPSYMETIPDDVFFSITGYTIPHIGLGYIASYLQENGHNVTLIECMGQSYNREDVFRVIDMGEYEAIGISVYDGNRVNAIRILNYIKRKYPDLFVFFGGYTATLEYESLLRRLRTLDCCVIGEGEITVLELVNCICSNASIMQVAGIAYRSGDEIIRTCPRKLIEDINFDIVNITLHFFLKDVRSMLPPAVNHSSAVS